MSVLGINFTSDEPVNGWESNDPPKVNSNPAYLEYQAASARRSALWEKQKNLADEIEAIPYGAEKPYRLMGELINECAEAESEAEAKYKVWQESIREEGKTE